MKRLHWILVAGLALLGPGIDSTVAKESEQPPTVAVISLEGPVTETAPMEDFPLGSSGGESLKALVDRLNKAAEQPDVKAVVLLVDHASLGFAQLEEIRAAMTRLQQAGKEVHAHADSLNTGRYALLSGATTLSVSPVGDVLITGLHGEQMFVRGLLDRLGVQPDFLTCGAYKSAAETFMRTSPSREAEEMTNWLLDSLYATTVELIAGGRKVPAEKVRQWIDQGVYSAQGAKEAGIIDAVEHRGDFVTRLKDKYGQDLEFDRKFGKKKPLDLDFSSPLGILRFYGELLSGGKKPRSTKDAVAIVYVDGPIQSGKPQPDPFSPGGQGAYSDPIRKALEAAAEEESIKAVVLRVDSPGGSAVASEVIHEATRRLAAKKPFVVSMGNTAASGGYYVSCAAKTIFAQPSTITGSIGVVTGKLATTGMWNKVGIHWKSYDRGKYAGLLSSAAVFSDDERQRLQAWMDDVYADFQRRVTQGRGDRLKKPLEEIAGGRVYTGRQALDLGLVDRMGGLHDAVRFAADQAGLGKYEVRVLPRPKSFLELLMSDLADDEEEGGTISVLGPATSLAAAARQAALPLLAGADPERLASLQQAITLLGLFEHEPINLVMPLWHLDR